MKVLVHTNRVGAKTLGKLHGSMACVAYFDFGECWFFLSRHEAVSMLNGLLGMGSDLDKTIAVLYLVDTHEDACDFLAYLRSKNLDVGDTTPEDVTLLAGVLHDRPHSLPIPISKR